MFVKCARKLSRKKKNGNYFKSDEEKKLTFFSKKSIFKSVWTISMPVEWLGPRYNCHSINKYPFLFSFLAWRRRELGTIHGTYLYSYDDCIWEPFALVKKGANSINDDILKGKGTWKWKAISHIWDYVLRP